MVGGMATASFAAGNRHANRQRNEWTGLAVGSAVLGIIGLANHNDGLALAGAVGTGYSLYREGNVRSYRDRDDRYDWDRDRAYRNRDRDDRFSWSREHVVTRRSDRNRRGHK